MANNVFQVKRTNVSGRTPNTTGSYVTNSQYIAAGEFALNMADGILYTSNGSAVIEVGANNTNQRITNSLTINNSRNLNFQTVNTSAAVYFTQQNDDNFVLYSTNTSYGARPVFGVFANSITSNLQIYIPLQLNSGVVANNSLGSAGQVLTTNSTGVYWSSVGGTGTVTSVATGNGMTGGPITTTGTVSVLANNGITANSTGVFAVAGLGTVVNSTGINVNANNGLTATAAGVFVTGNSGLIVNSTGVHVLANNGITANSTGTFVTQGTGVVVNATGVHVNAAYINTIAANSATFVLANNGIISNSTGVFVNGNNGLITNSTGVHVRANSGIVANATGTFVLANNGIIANATGVFVNGNNGLITNSTGVHVLANSGIIANSTGTFVNGNTGVVVNSTGVFVNATYIGTISANNASFLGGVAAASYQTTAGLAANVATLTSNNASFLGGVAAASYVNTSGAYTITGIHTYTANLVVNAAIIAGGNSGTAGQVLTSNGAGNVYWSTPSTGGTSNSVYMKGGAATIGTLASEGTNIFRVNANTLNYNTTISTGENAQATGPLSVASGITLTVESGARVAIV